VGQERTANVEHEAYEPMVVGKRQQDLVDENNVFEVVYQALAVQKVHCGAEEIPVQRFCKAQASGAAGNINDAHDLLEGNDLDGCYYEDDVDMAG
jgi:hypothetical protein